MAGHYRGIRSPAHKNQGPEDAIARLAALVPKPRAHLTRYHGARAVELGVAAQARVRDTGRA